jgi:hypothetical protein
MGGGTLQRMQKAVVSKVVFTIKIAISSGILVVY